MELAVSVIICTHNPKSDYFDKVLAALRSQTLLFEQWELLLIDNASEQLLSSVIDLSWHPKARHLREEELGLTPARLRGIREAKAETLVFVDDDNVLESDYLEVALQISKDYPMIAVWGGQTIPEFEVIPPDWTKRYWGYLAVREFEQERWSNLIHQHETTPYGAGLCVRKIVAEKYAYLVKHDPMRLGLGRKGSDNKARILFACEDTDIAFTSCDMGFGTGIFTALRLKHLIPASRITEEYLERIVEGTTYSLTILESFRGKIPNSQEPLWKIKLSEYYRLWKMHPKERRLFKAQIRGKALAVQKILNPQ
ncbi:glycosyltransferase [Tolypothrix sp. VBCCA 56010]|uniref:glycosyltransferase n=1 Tax=Tolypothrix sp. VBCCA 56010 TaxID=3137731 RepID=UPI003D7F1449